LISFFQIAAGKTRLINHFLINGAWYLVDLPGYG
jgi:GTP-binding protein